MPIDTSILPVLAGIFLLAFLAETLTEYFARPFLKPETLPGNERQGRHVVPAWCLRYAAALVGVGLAIAWSPWIGYVVTGLVIGRGSNYLNDLVDRWLAPLPRGPGGD
jgi:hypothetical protein